MALLAFDDHSSTPLSHLMSLRQRIKIASELNAAILLSQKQDKGESTPPPLLDMCRSKAAVPHQDDQVVTRDAGRQSEVPKDRRLQHGRMSNTRSMSCLSSSSLSISLGSEDSPACDPSSLSSGSLQSSTSPESFNCPVLG